MFAQTICALGLALDFNIWGRVLCFLCSSKDVFAEELRVTAFGLHVGGWMALAD
jgi:hypothetical protein